MKSLAKICFIVATVVTLAAYTAQAQADATTTTNAPAAAKPKPKRKQYTGTIASIDNDAKTITITMKNGKTQTVTIGSKTKIKKDGEPATLADATTGMHVRAFMKADDTGTASTILLGDAKPKAAAEPAAPAAPPAK